MDERLPYTLVRSGEGEPIWFNSSLISVIAPSDGTDGAYAIVEVLAAAGNATPLHVDPTVETFRVLEGDILVHVDGCEERLSSGDTIVIPRGVPHALLVTSATARMLVFNAPGGHDRFFRTAGSPGRQDELPPPRAPDLVKMKEAAAQYGMIIVGPPPFSGDSSRSSRP